MYKSIVSNSLTFLDERIDIWIDAFIQAKVSENLSKKTISFYVYSLGVFNSYCISQSVKDIRQITPNLIRELLLIREQDKHKSGGTHAIYRCIKVFLRWYWEETEPDYPNPINKVKPPKVINEILDGISSDNFKLLLDACSNNNIMGERDKTILYILLDTGVRASELCSINISDINPIDGSILIRMGKGRKPRYVFTGKTTRKQLRKYLRLRNNKSDSLFINKSGDRLVFVALREIIRRLCDKAGIERIGLHSFRRAFALLSIRKGVDLLTLSRLLGHSSLNLLYKYVKQNKSDVLSSYKSIIDNDD